jgi:flavin reductase (DIM6/NTAB) family NADH-FMN oxidoreductase RutF
MAKEISEQTGAFYQHYPGVAVIVTAHAVGRDNAMAVAWHMPVSKKPPLYAVSISPKRFTYQLIAGSGEFGVNFLPNEEAGLVAAVGGSKGKEIDKFEAFKIKTDKPLKTAVPILKSAYAAYECKVVYDRLYGDHRLLVGEILAVHWQKDAFIQDEILDIEKVSPVLYLGSDQYLGMSGCTVRTLDREACISYLKD